MTFDLHRDLEERFLRYVQVDTESDADSTSVPSTERQLDLLRMLEVELQQLGAEDVQLTDYATLLATIPATAGGGEAPTIAFMAHVDTTEAFPGLGVEPRVHRSWDGTPITFPKDEALVLSSERSPDLKAKIGQDVVTASGDTLLGADDKAGVAIVMSMARSLLEKSGTEHGRIRLCFTPDEEIGRGVDHLTPGDLDARWAYTLDGGNTGEISSETFSANMAVVTFRGVSVHPGTAYHDLVNACTLAAKFHAALPEHARTPETTRDREGFIHLYEMDGNAAEAELRYILRDFDNDRLVEHGKVLSLLAETMQAAHPRADIRCDITAQYRNMGQWLQEDMTPVEIARQAMRDIGLEPVDEPIRSGTDGSRLTEKGVPTPNLFTGMHDVHGPLEWVTIQDMALAVRTCLRIAELWTEA